MLFVNENFWRKKEVMHQLNIQTDNSTSLCYEYRKRSWVYYLFAWAVGYWAAIKILLFGVITKKNLFELRDHIEKINSLFDYSDQLKIIRKGAASWRALDVLYNYNRDYAGKDIWLKRIESQYWIGGAHNSQAIRNRLKLSKFELKKSISKYLPQETEIRIFSIASGSAQAVVEALSELIMEVGNFNFKVMLLDNDQTAIDASKKLAERAGMAARFTFVRGKTDQVQALMLAFQPQIVEMIGFLDYRPKVKAIELVRRIKNLLPTGGVFLTCNIRKNLEKPLVDFCLMWPMIYRSPVEFAEIFLKAGYPASSFRIVYEPFMIHGLAICEN